MKTFLALGKARRSVQPKLNKIGARAVYWTRRVIFQMAELAVPKGLFAQIPQQVWALTPGGG